MISKAVNQYATENGFNFYVQGCGYRALVEITDLVGNHISWTCNKSKSALQAINTLIKQKQLDAKSNEAIAVEATEAHELIEEVAAPAIVAVEEDEWTKAWNKRFANYTDEDWAREMGSSNGMVSDRADRGPQPTSAADDGGGRSSLAALDPQGDRRGFRKRYLSLKNIHIIQI